MNSIFEANTIISAFFSQVQQQREAPFVWENPGSRVAHALSWKESAELVSAYSRALSTLGVHAGDRIAILAPPSAKTLLAFLGNMLSRTTTVCIPSTLPPDIQIQALSESRAQIVITADHTMAGMLHSHAERLNELRMILALSPTDTVQEDTAIATEYWDAMIARGKKQPDRLSQWIQEVQPDDSCALIYQNNEEPPLAAVLKHHQALLEENTTVHELCTENGCTPNQGETFLCTTELGHTSSFAIGQLFGLLQAGQTHYLPANRLSQNALLSIRPHILISPSHTLSQLKEWIKTDMLSHADRLERFIFEQALRFGKLRYEHPQKGTWWQKIMHTVLKQIIVDKVRRRLGGNLVSIIAEDEEVDYGTQLFFYAFGIHVTEIPPSSTLQKKF